MRGTSDEDGALVAQALAGGADGFREIVERYQRPVFSIVLRLVRDRSLAEDLAQETFFKAHRALASFDRSRKFSSWLFTIAHNTAIDHLRRRSLDTVPLETADEQRDVLEFVATPPGEGPENVVLGRDLERVLNAALETLRPEYAEVLMLRFQEGLAYEEIVEVTGLPLGTVKTHLHRARRALADRLREAGWGPGS